MSVPIEFQKRFAISGFSSNSSNESNDRCSTMCLIWVYFYVFFQG